MKCLFANPNIAPHVKETLAAYYEHQYLDKFFTSYYFDTAAEINQLISKYLPSFARELKRRSVDGFPSACIKSRPLAELFRVFSSRTMNSGMTDRIWEWSEIGFDKWVARHLTPTLGWVHVSEHAALATLQNAKKVGIMSIYEQPSQHHQFFTDIVKRQMKVYPAFKNEQINLLIDEKAVRRNRRRDQELKIADVVLCNSSFTKKTLLAAGVVESKIITVPLGFPLVKENPTDRGSNNIVFMYAGNFSLRKGIHLLLQAWKELSPPNAELWLIGRKELPSVFFEDLPESIKVFSNIPHHDLLIKYRQANVFILPTLADGFGMVITEAMSSGVPVITTWNSGGADLIEEKKNGLVIAPESKEAITEAVRWCLQHKDDLLAMGRHAQAKAVHYPWSAFRKKLIVEIVSKKIEWESKRKSALLHPAI